MKIKQIEKYIQLYNIENYLFKVVGPNVKEKGYLSFDDFYNICMWKSVRQKQNYLKNKNMVEEITKNAFKEDSETEKIDILCKLKGIGIKTASAILTVVFPEKYAVMDERCLDILIDYGFKISKYASIKTWVLYLNIMRNLAKENNISPRELDMAFFAMHKEKLKKENNRNLYRK